jgi:hypothetical protein
MTNKPTDDRPSFPTERDDAKLLGVDTEGTPIYYDPVAHVKLSGDRNYEDHVPEWAHRENLSPDVSVSDLVAEIEEKIGWKEKSEYGEEHS